MNLTLGVAGRAVIRDGAKILVLRRAAAVFDGGLWELPGGKLEAGEELVAALVREISEETSLTVHVGRPFATWHFAKDRFWVTGITFHCDRISGEVVLSQEHSEYEWIAPAEYSGRPLATAIEGQLRAYVELLADGCGD